MRTFDRQTYLRIQEAWVGFGSEWRELRLIAAENGYPLPPDGSAFDERDDPEPSMRAIIWHALDFRRQSTLALAKRSRSWSELVGRIFAEESGLRESASLRERDAAWERRDEPTPQEAVQALGQIIGRIKESVS